MSPVAEPALPAATYADLLEHTDVVNEDVHQTKFLAEANKNE